MTTYKEIKGDVVETVASDPANPGAGDIWYNTTTGVLKGGEYLAAWSSGGNLPGAKRDGGLGSVGTQDAGLAFGGEPITSDTFEYNGTSWSPGGSMNTGGRSGGSFGPQTAAGTAGRNESVGSTPSTKYEEYNGTSWSEQNDLPTGKRDLAGAGTQTAAVVMGGATTVLVGTADDWDGSSWTAGGSLSTARRNNSGGGTQTAAITSGGVLSYGPPYPPGSNATEEYNGTSWTTGGNLNTGRGISGSSGTQTAFMQSGGDTTFVPSVLTTAAEHYDGTVWVTTASMATARAGFKGTGGTQTAGYVAGGYAPESAATEEFTAAPITRTFTTS